MAYQEFAAIPEGLAVAKSPSESGNPAALGGLALYGCEAPPAIGARVRVNFNSLGYGEVVGYFAEDGYFGMRVKADQPPEWWLKQNAGKRWIYHVFGPEWEIA